MEKGDPAWSWISPDVRDNFLAPLRRAKSGLDAATNTFARTLFSTDIKKLRKEMDTASLEASCGELRTQMEDHITKFKRELDLLVRMTESRAL